MTKTVWLRHLKIDDADELTDKENLTMYEFMSLGYELYNIIIPGNVYCPENIKELIIQVINKAVNNQDTIKALQNLLQL